MTHGRQSKLALRKEREAILQTWQERYRGPDGNIDPIIAAHLRQIATLEAISDRALRWTERTNEPITSTKHLAAIHVIQDCADKIYRHIVALNELTSDDLLLRKASRRLSQSLMP